MVIRGALFWIRWNGASCDKIILIDFKSTLSKIFKCKAISNRKRLHRFSKKKSVTSENGCVEIGKKSSDFVTQIGPTICISIECIVK